MIGTGISIGIEVETTCGRCGNLVPVNALVTEIRCELCDAPVEMTLFTWEQYLRRHLRLAPRMGPGESHREQWHTGSAVSSHREPPAFADGTPVDIQAALAGLKAGFINSPSDLGPFSVRRVPEPFRKTFPGLEYLLGEAIDLLPTAPESARVTVPKTTEAEAFKCLSCAGTIRVDGRSRFITCPYCGAESYLPDDLWRRLNPSRSLIRWYLWYDERTFELQWNEVADATTDDAGNVYFVYHDSMDDEWLVTSLAGDGERRWLRGLLRGRRGSPDDADLELTEDSRLRVRLWTTRFELGLTDGAVTKSRDAAGQEKLRGLLEDARSWARDRDGTVLAILEGRDETGTSGEKLVRYGSDGREDQVWRNPYRSREGLMGRLKRLAMGEAKVPPFERISHSPGLFRGFRTRVSVGRDGFYYLLHDHALARYESNGKQVYLLQLPAEDCVGAPRADAEGRAYVLAKAENGQHRIVRVSADGTAVEDWATAGMDGIPLADRVDRLDLAPTGTVYLFGPAAVLHIFDSAGNAVYASKEARAG